MRKAIQILSIAVVSLGLSTAVVAADGISNTGPNSNNTITNTQNNNTDVNCNNNVDVNSSNLQDANSGNAGTDGNTSGGNASSGSASNDNSSNVNVNTGCETVAAAPTTPSQAYTNNGSGAGAQSSTPAKASVPAGTAVAALPNTGSDTAAKVAVSAAAVLAIIAAVSRFGVRAVRGFSL